VLNPVVYTWAYTVLVAPTPVPMPSTTSQVRLASSAPPIGALPGRAWRRGARLRCYVKSEGWRWHRPGKVRKSLPINPRRQSELQARLSVSHGTTFIRSHVDVDTECGVSGIEGVMATREARWPTLSISTSSPSRRAACWCDQARWNCWNRRYGLAPRRWADWTPVCDRSRPEGPRRYRVPPGRKVRTRRGYPSA
jgi:hypothetical protein